MGDGTGSSSWSQPRASMGNTTREPWSRSCSHSGMTPTPRVPAPVMGPHHASDGVDVSNGDSVLAEDGSAGDDLLGQARPRPRVMDRSPIDGAVALDGDAAEALKPLPCTIGAGSPICPAQQSQRHLADHESRESHRYNSRRTRRTFRCMLKTTRLRVDQHTSSHMPARVARLEQSRHRHPRPGCDLPGRAGRMPMHRHGKLPARSCPQQQCLWMPIFLAPLHEYQSWRCRWRVTAHIKEPMINQPISLLHELKNTISTGVGAGYFKHLSSHAITSNNGPDSA